VDPTEQHHISLYKGKTANGVGSPVCLPVSLHLTNKFSVNLLSFGIQAMELKPTRRVGSNKMDESRLLSVRWLFRGCWLAVRRQLQTVWRGFMGVPKCMGFFSQFKGTVHYHLPRLSTHDASPQPSSFYVE
jgi:hypothetical protein